MRMMRFAQVAWSILLSLSVGTPAAMAENRCAFGGSEIPVEGGIGGTGALPPGPDDDGIGGTGISTAQTGVIGTVSGFASLCVGTLEIHYADDTPVTIDGATATIRELGVGQVVQVTARGDGLERRAQAIAVEHVVGGPVTAVDRDAGVLTVIGQRVEVQPATRIDLPDGEVLTTADSVRVSGMRRDDGTIVASRIERTATTERALLVGALERSRSGQASIAGTPITTDAAATAGALVRAVGRWVDGRLQASAVASLPATPFDGQIQRVSIEGFAVRARGGLRVGDVNVRSGRGAESLASVRDGGTRLRVEGMLVGADLIVDRVDRIDDLPVRPAPPRDGGRGGFGAASRGGVEGPGDRGGPGAPPSPDRGGSWMPGDRPQRGDANGMRPTPPDMPNRPARPDTPDRPDRPERPLPPGPPGKPDRPNRPDRPGRP